MKAKLKQFYQEKIVPGIEALKAKATQLKEQATARLARFRRRMSLVVITITGLMVVATVAYIWHRSPALQARAGSVIAALTGGLASLWALFRGHRPTEIPVPVVVTEPSHPRQAEALFPAEYRAEEGRL